MKKFLIDVSKNYIRTALTNMGELLELIAEERSDEPRAGDILTGRVVNTVKKQYAFVDIGAQKNGFLHIEGRNIQQGQALTVIVEKPSYGEKGCALSLDLSLSGRLAVVTTDSSSVGISHKITDDAVRSRLADTAKDALSNGFGCIVRTNAADETNEALSDEISAMSEQLADIIEKGKYAKPPYRLYRQSEDTMRLLRDCSAKDDEIIVNDKDYLAVLLPSFPQAKLYDGKIPLFSEYGIESRIDKLLQRKVWLDCGGFLVIDHTEAMTVIDVNTGKFTDGVNMRKAALKTNLQAAKETARQLRLRNISGIIIVDLVNMKHSEDIAAVEATFKEAVSHDRLKTVFVGITSLGLAQLTRQKQNVALHTLFKRPCGACSGSGEVTNYRYVCDKVRNGVINIFANTVYPYAVVSGGDELIKYIEKNADLESLAEKYGKTVKLRIEKTAASDYYEISGQNSIE